MKYDKDKISAKILAAINKGTSLRGICNEDNMPYPSTFLKWCDADKELAQQYARAMEVRAELLAEEIVAIADDASNDLIQTEDGLFMPNRAAIDRARVRIDARKWYAGKVAPKKYGDKVTQEHTGEGGGAIQITIKDMS